MDNLQDEERQREELYRKKETAEREVAVLDKQHRDARDDIAKARVDSIWPGLATTRIFVSMPGVRNVIEQVLTKTDIWHMIPCAEDE